MTGVCFPLELGIVCSRLRVQERRILFNKFIKFYQIWIKTVLNSITWVKHKINSGFEVVVVLGLYMVL